MEAFERCVKPFVVSGEPSEACWLGEASFDHPSAWQQDEASLGHGVLDDFEPDAMLSGRFGGLWARVALVDVGKFHRPSGYLLNLFGARRYL